jgi:hypothetical protein
LDQVLLSALTQKSFLFEPAERIRQTPSQIEPMLGVPKQVIGPIVERKFENKKGVACRRLIIKRKMHGVSDGFRISSIPQDYQEDQTLLNANHGKMRQKIRKSATRRNQDSTSQDSLTDPAASDTEQPS